MNQQGGQPSVPRRSYWGLRGVAFATLVLSLVMLVATFQIRQGGGYSAVGPRAFPLAVSLGLLALSLIFLARTTLFPDHDLAEHAAVEEAETHWPTVGLLAATLVFYVFALAPLGYVVATTLFVVAGAWILRGRITLAHFARDIAVGLILAAVVYFGFTRFLGVRLPAGILDLIL